MSSGQPTGSGEAGVAAVIRGVGVGTCFHQHAGDLDRFHKMDRRAADAVQARRAGAAVEQHAHDGREVPVHRHGERRFARALPRRLVVEVEIELQPRTNECSKPGCILLHDGQLQLVALLLQRRQRRLRGVLCDGLRGDAQNEAGNHALHTYRIKLTVPSEASSIASRKASRVLILSLPSRLSSV